MKKRILLLVLIILIIITCFMVYKTLNPKKTPTDPIEIEEHEELPPIDEEQVEEIIDEELNEERIESLVEGYLQSQDDEVKIYKLNKVSLDSNTDELKTELNYELTDELVYVEYESKPNGGENWTPGDINKFVLRKENGRYFILKAGNEW